MTQRLRAGGALAALYVGTALTFLAALAPYLDRATTRLMAAHIRDGYPSYTAQQVDAGVTTFLVLSTVIGVFGLLAWATTLWAVRAGKSWARAAATTGLLLGATTGLTGLLVKDTSGAPGLPPAFGWAGMLPVLAGAVAVALLWWRPQRG